MLYVDVGFASTIPTYYEAKDHVHITCREPCSHIINIINSYFITIT